MTKVFLKSTVRPLGSGPDDHLQAAAGTDLNTFGVGLSRFRRKEAQRLLGPTGGTAFGEAGHLRC